MGDNAILTQRHIFGLKGDVKRLVHFVEEATVAYPCGHHVVLYNTETKEQELIHGMVAPPLASGGITAMALTPNRKYLAVAERSSERGVVNIYDAASRKRRKMLSYADLGSKDVVYVSFSGDSKLCLTQGGAPEWQLVLWTFDRAAKPVASTRVSQGAVVNQVDFCPQDATVVCATGQGLLKFMRISESQFRPIASNQKREPQSYACHCWLPEERLVAATTAGDLVLYENYEFRMVLSTGGEASTRIESLCAYSKGFVCGGSAGSLRIYERSEDVRESFKCLKVFRIENCGPRCSIGNLVISPSEETLLCATNDHQMYTFTLSNTDILKEDSMNFDLLSTSFHGPGPDGSAEIYSMDVCVWKPLIATCGADRTVRIWNYQERTVELMKRFEEEEPLSVALHPSGLYVLVGFADKLRFMSLLMDDIRAVYELNIKACRECAFAHGGHAFAAANNAVVQIIATYTHETLANLRGHNGRVRSIRWSRGDRRLVTMGGDGAVFVWKVREAAKDGEHVLPRCAFLGGAASPDFRRIFCVADDRTIREFLAPPSASTSNSPGTSETPKGLVGAHSGTMSLSNVSASSEQHQAGGSAAMQQVVTPAKSKLCDTLLGCAELTANSRVLFVGTADDGAPGFVTAHPMQSQHSRDDWEQLEAQRYVAHADAVSCMRLSHDGLFLFTAGVDGSLALFQVHELDGRGQVVRGSMNRDAAGGTEFTEEILVTKSDLEDKGQQMLQLRLKVDELVLNNEYQLRLKDMKYKERIAEISDKFTSELRADAGRYEELMEDKRRMELDYEDRLHSLEDKHKHEFRDLETQYDAKISTEVTRYRALVTERDEQNAKWDDENRTSTSMLVSFRG
ncbi:quinon protein alcohol dehydrogenase-like superfamily [Pelagophyceae sp. CCMP2097]|nr:quinon protein alcohol dehydrogenase-like superfamily [Pelagophyceae sp. CCMP2097]